MLQQRAHSELDHQGNEMERWPGSTTTGHIEGERYGSTPGQWRSNKTISSPYSTARNDRQLLQQPAH
jgi:hypothetical protein